MTEVESYCTHCGLKIEPTSGFCSHCGRAAPLAAAQAAATTAVAPKSRPTGVTIVAILNIIGGIAMFATVILASIGASISPTEETVSAVQTIGAILIAVGIVSFVVAYGVLKGRPWAWTLTVIVSIINIVVSVILIALFSIVSILNIIMSGLILYYLYRRHVKAYFGKTISSSSGRSSVAH
jgi:hypothetical protein